MEKRVEKVQREYEDALQKEKEREREAFERLVAFLGNTDDERCAAVIGYSGRCFELLEECREKLLALLLAEHE
jgi:hypothetical protein